jgi:hypothetical protein
MVRNSQIKVIKREERNRLEEKKSAKVENSKKLEKEEKRNVVATVSNWVTDFQQRRRDEARQAIKTLFVDTPRPSQV